MPNPDRTQPQYSLNRYTGSRNLADLVLTATYSREMYRSAVHNQRVLDLVLGCMLLAELVEAGRAEVTADAVIHPALAGHARGRDPATDGILHEMRQEQRSHPADEWVNYLALRHRATTLVWQRLVSAGAAEAERSRYRRRSTFVLTGAHPTDWARQFLLAVSGAALLPASAVILWHALEELLLTDDIRLPAPLAHRLDTATVPHDANRLLSALDRALTRLTTQR